MNWMTSGYINLYSHLSLSNTTQNNDEKNSFTRKIRQNKKRKRDKKDRKKYPEKQRKTK